MRPVTMISRKSLFKISIVSSVAFATIISGCRLPRAKCRNCRRCDYHQTAPHNESVVVVDANPYNLPQNADCFEASPATPPAVAEPPRQEIAPPEAKEIESIPEVEEQVAPNESSRISRPDESTEETMAQLQPPVADSPYDFESFPEPPQVASETLKPKTSPESAPVQKPIVDESLVNEKPYYIVNEKPTAPISKPDNFRPFPAELQSEEKKPGAAFEQFANEIFQDIDLRENLDLKPVPSQPASFIPPKTDSPSATHDQPSSEEASQESSSKTTESEEIFGAIQFDAVLRQAKYGHYAQESQQPEPRVAALESKNAFLIRPLPELNQPVPRIASEPYEFQPMPAYHMPTLRAIPETEDWEELPSVGKIRFMDLPTSPTNESVTIQNPHINDEVPSTDDTEIIAVPVDPQPMIQSLPDVEKVPVNREFQATSDRRLTNRNMDSPNPLR